METLNNVTPGEILQEEFLIPLGISQYHLAKELNITQTIIFHAAKSRLIFQRTPPGHTY